MVSIRGFSALERCGLAEVCGYAEEEMSICGTLVSLEWSRLAVFKEVTTTVWQLMARFCFFFVFFLLAEKNQIYQNTFKIQKKKKRKERGGMSVFCVLQTHTCVRFICMCVGVCVY